MTKLFTQPNIISKKSIKNIKKFYIAFSYTGKAV